MEMDELNFSQEQLSEAKDEGYRAYQNGHSSRDNPYNNNEEWPLLSAWIDGYCVAAWGD
jgi:ribosome modulation factor